MNDRGYSRVKWRRSLYYPILLLTSMLMIMQTRALFFSYGWRWLYVLTLSTCFSFCLTPLFSRIAQKFGVMDIPDSRKTHKQATPLLGGAAIFIAFIFSLIANGLFSLEVWTILVTATILFIIGIIDDIKHVPAKIKLIIQLICTILVIKNGIILRVIPDDYGIFAIYSNAILTVIWIIGITNAMNFFDGMDGLAAGLGITVSFFLGILAFQTKQPFLGWVSVGILGSCLGFLPYNFHIKGNASIFLGDAGSTVLGFILACIAVYGEWASDNIIALVSPILIFWIFIFDMVYISIDRVITGKVTNFRGWLDYVGRDHLHHRLDDVLGGKKKSVLVIYLISICLGTSAIVLRNAVSIDAVLLIIQAVIIVALISILERHGRALKNNRMSLKSKK